MNVSRNQINLTTVALLYSSSAELEETSYAAVFLKHFKIISSLIMIFKNVNFSFTFIKMLHVLISLTLLKESSFRSN